MKAYADAHRSSLREAVVADHLADSPRTINRLARNDWQRCDMTSGRFGTMRQGQPKKPSPIVKIIENR
ncbi:MULTISPECIES: hypothetical protein [Burkholderia cepacia complex]|uniref:hypothetical protein n=1 Tax=Burkholderia cepacia complex TaxID=87882 RepID=UPI0011465A2D|nr:MULTISPECIES: hypothetical protein [Burkholderia cepacia complex]